MCKVDAETVTHDMRRCTLQSWTRDLKMIGRALNRRDKACSEVLSVKSYCKYLHNEDISSELN